MDNRLNLPFGRRGFGEALSRAADWEKNQRQETNELANAGSSSEWGGGNLGGEKGICVLPEAKPEISDDRLAPGLGVDRLEWG
jgi:hypothetical protein